MNTPDVLFKVLLLCLLASEAHSFTSICPTGSPPSGQQGPSSNLLHISAWTTTEASIYSKANHDTLWTIGGAWAAEWESGDLDPSGSTGYVSWILTQPMDPVFMLNYGETRMRFYWSGGGMIPPGWLNFWDECEGAGVIF